ncbi:sugar phosphate isomerase/epimerase family protein [Paenibacillus sp. HGF5]|uniref:sugar phosphate isomerase/epimerase family protein n=2 Tax=Paenibacillus TaxID=44249 RepID=UPI0002071F84|nr:sugar phosphate isomerase/epimerase [Paenibacillus sp. HGF5]EGG37371.1 AP endonuclease, family 2 [Paenibacillus sp. HGF5]
MKVAIYKALWGMTGSWEESFKQIAEAGYDGVEAGLPGPQDQQRFMDLLEQYQLKFIAQIYTHGNHSVSFEEQLLRAKHFSPVKIVSHSAQDCMPFRDQLRFFGRAVMLEAELGVQVAHETHRGRAMFTPWNTARLLQHFPQLKLTADFSHWCAVCESLLENQVYNVKLAISRSVHIHARVGYAQGPQVPHPAAPEYQQELLTHTRWWREIYQHRSKEGAECLSVTTEFGPPNYLHTLPFSNEPVANLWEVCDWMRQFIAAEIARESFNE